MLLMLMAFVNIGRVRLSALRGFFWLLLTGGFLSGLWGCWPVMMYGPGPDYDEGPVDTCQTDTCGETATDALDDAWPSRP